MKKEVYLTSCISLDFDLGIMPAFFDHYISIGVKPENFILVLNVFRENPEEKIQKAANIIKGFNVSPDQLIWNSEYESEAKWSLVHQRLNNRIPSDGSAWIIHPDADEFHRIDDVSKQVEILEANSCSAMQGILIDRTTLDGSIPEKNEFERYSALDRKFPNQLYLANLIGIAGVKLMMYRSDFRANNGSGQIHPSMAARVVYPYGNKSLHELKEFKEVTSRLVSKNESRTPILVSQANLEELISGTGCGIVDHYKWHGTVIDKLQQRVRTYTRLQRPQVVQSIKFLKLYKQNGSIEFLMSGK